MDNNELKETVMKQKEGIERLSDEMYHTYKEMENLNLKIESCKEKFEVGNKMYRRMLLMMGVLVVTIFIIATIVAKVIAKS